MTEYSGSVTELAQEVGQALDAIHKVLSSMQGKTHLYLASKDWQPDLAAIEHTARKLQGNS